MTELENIYNMYFKDVFLYARVLTGNEHIAEDITSETFMKAIKSIDSFEGRCDIRVWLCQIAKNSYISYLRKNNELVNINELEKQADKANTEQLKVTGKQKHSLFGKQKYPLFQTYSNRCMYLITQEILYADLI